MFGMKTGHLLNCMDTVPKKKELIRRRAILRSWLKRNNKVLSNNPHLIQSRFDKRDTIEDLEVAQHAFLVNQETLATLNRTTRPKSLTEAVNWRDTLLVYLLAVGGGNRSEVIKT